MEETSGVKVPPPLLYLAGFLAGVALEAAVPVDRPPLAVTLAATAITLVAWWYFDGRATVAFTRAKTSMIVMKPSTTLVTEGPYQLTRNPMYVGMAFFYVAIALAVGLVWPLAFLPLVLIAVDRLVIAREEPYLLRRFGAPYADYTARVRRWL